MLLAPGASAELRAAARLAGFDRVLDKPVTASALRATLTELLHPEWISARRAPADPTPLGRLEAALRAGHAGQRVLLAEDNAVNREIAAEMLRAAGLVVEEAVDGEDALALARRRPVDLLLLDVRMPRLGGIEVARTLRHEGHAAPMLAMTANAFLEDRAASLAAGMNEHIAKPIATATLYHALLRWLPRPSAAAGAVAPPRAAGARPRTTREPARPSDRRAVLDRLRTVDGFDLERGLAGLGDDVEALLTAVSDFVHLYANGVALPVDASGIDRREALADTCHSFFGAAATIGAGPVADRARALERRLKAGGTIEEATEEFVSIGRALDRLVRSLGEALGAVSVEHG